MIKIISINNHNIAQEHICCAISDSKGDTGVACKKAWMQERFDDGLVFKKLDVRGKVFIEYIPAEKAWHPIDAPNFMHINCFWVSGQHQGQGYANELLEECITDAKNKGHSGLTVLSSAKKMPFLSDPAYLKYKGFQIADKAEPYFELLYYPFDKNTQAPQFKAHAKLGHTQEKGMVLYYTHQCPFSEKYAQIIHTVAAQNGYDIKLVRFESAQQARQASSPYTSYSFYHDGKLITHEIFSGKKFQKYLDKLILKI